MIITTVANFKNRKKLTSNALKYLYLLIVFSCGRNWFSPGGATPEGGWQQSAFVYLLTQP